MNTNLSEALSQYMINCKTTDWILKEVYKIEFANFVFNSVNWDNDDMQILDVLKFSQQIKYTDVKTHGVQFIIKSGRKKLSHYIDIADVQNFRKLLLNDFDKIDWSNRTMSFPGMSAWVSSLFPNKLIPTPATGFDITAKHLFNNNEKLPKQDLSYLICLQPYLKKTKKLLKSLPIEQLWLKELNLFYSNNKNLKLKPKNNLDEVDWNWITQDFFLFVERELININPINKDSNITVFSANEGTPKLTTHLTYERNSNFIKKVKTIALKNNPLLNCEICGFSFVAKYGKIGEGYIEAHHKVPLSELKKDTKINVKDIALVCSNCHNMLHRQNPSIKVDELKRVIKKLNH